MITDTKTAGAVNPRYANLTGGSRKGIPNKINGDIKAMILEALNKKGGADYLVEQAESNPAAFLGLVGKVLPMTVNAEVEGQIVITWQK